LNTLAAAPATASSFLNTLAPAAPAGLTIDPAAATELVKQPTASSLLESLAAPAAVAATASTASSFLHSLAAEVKPSIAPSAASSLASLSDPAVAPSRAKPAPKEEEEEEEEDPTAPCLEIGIHSLRFSAYQLALFRSAGITSVHASAHVFATRTPLVTAPAELGLQHATTSAALVNLPLRWSSTDAASRRFSHAADGAARPLALVRVKAGTRAARALLAAVASAEPRAASLFFAVHATFGADENEDEDEEEERIAEAEVGLRQLLSSRRELDRVAVGLFDSQRREVGCIVVTVRALTACDAIGATPPVNAAVGRALGAPTSSRRREAAPAADPAAAASLAEVGWVDAAAACDDASGPAIDLRKVQLPLHLSLSFSSLVLSPRAAADASVQRLHLEVDLVGISDGALATQRRPKPLGGKPLDFGRGHSLPIYNHAAAARCLECAFGGSGVNSSATGGSGVNSGSSGVNSSGHAFSSTGGREDTAKGPVVRIRLVGVGRSGILRLGSVEVPLCALLGPDATEEWVTFTALGDDASPPPDASEPASRLLLGCRLLPPATPAAALPRPPPPQGAADPQICLELHSLRLKLPAALRLLGHTHETGADPYADSGRAAMHTLWLSVRFPGVPLPIESERIRLASLVAPPQQHDQGTPAGIGAFSAAAIPVGREASSPAMPAGRERIPPAGIPAVPSYAASGAEGLPGVDQARSVAPRAMDSDAAEPGWSRRADLGAVAALELHGEGSEPFATLKRLMGGGASAPMSTDVKVRLMASGRKGARVVAACHFSLTERMVAGSDLVRAPLVLRALPPPRGKLDL